MVHSSKQRSVEPMKKQNFGTMIATLRKEKGMTQLDLAEKMGVTDKAVSKWERDLSFPDVNSLPKLAEIFEVSVDELMQVKAEEKEKPKNEREELISLIFKGVALAMGVSVAVLSFLNQIEPNSAIGMLGIGLACISVSLFQKKCDE
jgi:transcriptional regulator with XRE-family HTH domain